MEDRPKIVLVCGGDKIIEHLVQVLADVKASNNSSQIVIVETEEEAQEINMLYQPARSILIYIGSHKRRYYEDFRIMMSDGQEGAFTQSAFVNKFALSKEKKNRKNNNKVQFKNKMFKFYNRKRNR